MVAASRSEPWEAVVMSNNMLEGDIDNGVRQQSTDLTKCDSVWEDVRNELYRATRQHGPLASAHEGYAVILEELDELWHEIKHGDKKSAHKEAIQVAAMAVRLIADVYRRATESKP